MSHAGVMVLAPGVKMEDIIFKLLLIIHPKLAAEFNPSLIAAAA
jgi:hypothetical protein